MTTVIKNGRIVRPDCCGFIDEDLLIEDGIIRAIGNVADADTSIDVAGKYILPGLIDIHTHGSIGINYSLGSDLGKLLRFYASCGVTTVLPSLGANKIDVLVANLSRLVAEKELHKDGARIGGIHLEGPFISIEKRGAMEVDAPSCTLENFKRLFDAGNGEIKLMAIAPELENALDVIHEALRCGVRVSLGHTMATYDQAMAAIKAGVNHATHTFNAMRAYNHREPGVLGAVLTEPSVSCEVICDMVHLAPATVKLIHLVKGLDKMILISDSSMVTGLPDGEYTFGKSVRIIKDGVSKNQSGTIAASCFTMADDAKKLVKEGYSLADIARIGALNPARAVGLDKTLGTVEVGKYADLLICDDEMNIERVFLRGKTVTSPPPETKKPRD